MQRKIACDMNHKPPGWFPGSSEKCIRNTIPVNTKPGNTQNIGDLAIFEGEELRRFLLNPAIFPESYIPKNKAFLSFMEFRKMPFSLDTMVEFIEHKEMKKQTVAPATVRNRKYAMKRICQEMVNANPEKWSALDEFRLETFFARLKNGSRQSRAVDREKILTRDQVKSLLQHSSGPWKLILLFLASTGVRVTEMVSIIRPKCVERQTDVEITITGKGLKQRTVLCSRDLFIRICNSFPSKYYLFATSLGKQMSRQHVWRGCNRLGRIILGKSMGAHTFRHSFATHMLEKGVELKRVSDFMGHSDTQMTLEMYVHLEKIGIDDIPLYDY